MISTNIFLQDIVAFDGTGLEQFAPLGPELSHRVADGRLCQALYFRGGNSTDELIVVALFRDGVVMRYFPIGARSDVHVPLRVVEDIDGGSVIELQVAAPAGVAGTVVIDLGMVEH
jgi:assimilatory nitrate reductase catalytic subunit